MKDDRVERSRYGGVVLTRLITNQLGYARVGSNPTADVSSYNALIVQTVRTLA